MTSMGQSNVANVRAFFGVLGLVAAGVGAWQAYIRTESWILTIFVGLLAANYVSRGLGDIVTDPEKGRRFVFFTLPVVLAAVGVAVGYLLWSTWWIAVVVGFVLNMVGGLVTALLFPRIAVEEVADNRSRMGAVHHPGAGTPTMPTNSDYPQAPSPYNKQGF